MFWADRAADEFLATLSPSRKEKGKFLVRDEKTASGHPHVGSLVGVALHDVMTRVLRERGVDATFLYEINDTDNMDGLPIYLDAAVYQEHMGKPLFRVPAPDDSAPNLAEYFANDFRNVITGAGYTPQFYTLSSLYLTGKMNDAIRTALTHADRIRAIYKEVSGSHKDDDWLPLNVICESCGKSGTTKVTSFDGARVTYVCQPTAVTWAVGCGHEGSVAPFDGNATLPWKVEWPAKFKVLGVDIEGAGKDHSTRGGARDVADHIAREVFGYEPPYNIPYEFFLVGGKKMSSSKGNAATARAVADALPSHILSLALIGREVNRQSNFDPEGDSIPLLFDKYDTLAQAYWHGADDVTEQAVDHARMFALIHTAQDATLLTERFLPRFSQIAFLVQMPHLSLTEEVARMKGSALTDADRAELEMRAAYARRWLADHAPEKYRFTIHDAVPDAARAFSEVQKRALRRLRAYVEEHESLDGEALHHALHAIKEEEQIAPKELFSAIYLTFLGRDSGPQAGWFLSTLSRDLLLSHLTEVTS